MAINFKNSESIKQIANLIIEVINTYNVINIFFQLIISCLQNYFRFCIKSKFQAALQNLPDPKEGELDTLAGIIPYLNEMD